MSAAFAKGGINGDFASRYRLGNLVKGVVSGFAPYGAFLRFEDGVVGLLHRSMLSAKAGDKKSISDILSIGQEVVGVVTSVDEQKGKCAISTKKIEGYPGEMLVNATNVFASAADNLER